MASANQKVDLRTWEPGNQQPNNQKVDLRTWEPGNNLNPIRRPQPGISEVGTPLPATPRPTPKPAAPKPTVSPTDASAPRPNPIRRPGYIYPEYPTQYQPTWQFRPQQPSGGAYWQGGTAAANYPISAPPWQSQMNSNPWGMLSNLGQYGMMSNPFSMLGSVTPYMQTAYMQAPMQNMNQFYSQYYNPIQYQQMPDYRGMVNMPMLPNTPTMPSYINWQSNW